MKEHLMQRAPQIAREFIGTWHAHLQALDAVALPYLDHLIEAALEYETLQKWQLQSKLCKMLPNVTPGTVGRILDLRFGYSNAEKLLPRSAA